MHKKAKRAAAKVLALVLTVSVAGVAAPDSQAAKKPKLSTKTVTVSVKKSKKVKIKNVKAKQVKKLTVKSNKAKTASVKKNGKTAFTITGKKAGTATVTAKLTLKGKKKATSLKVKVKVKGTATPVTSDTPSVSTAPTAAPVTAAPSEDGSTTPPDNSDQGNIPPSGPTITKYDPAPSPGVKRITNTSSIQNPIISNITIWGMRDNPNLKTGYDYNQYGPYSGIITKWYEPKEAIKALSELFNAETAQSLQTAKTSSYLAAGDDASAAEDEAETTPDPLGTSGQTVKSLLTLESGPDANLVTKQTAIEFVSRTAASNMANQTVKVVDSKSFTEEDQGGEPAVQVSGRKNNWHGIQIDITDYVKDPDKDYIVSIDVTHKTKDKDRVRMDLEMSYEYADGSDPGNYPVKNQNTTVTSGNWVNLDFEYNVAGMDYAKHWLVINWYGEGEGKDVYDDFFVKNLKIKEVYSDKVYDSTETLALDPIYTNTESKYGFSFGAVVGNATFGNTHYKGIIDKHFSSLTVDNDLKMYSLLDADATKVSEDGMPVLKENTAGEEVVKWAYENGIGVRGHTIICDTAMDTNCAYFFHEDYDVSKPLASREVMLKRLESFITQCIAYFEQKYPGTIHTWDLVNEAIETGSGGYEANDDRRIQIKDNLFYDTIGKDYVEYSFLYGRQAVNALKEMYPDRDINVKLFYNDFNCFQSSKRNAICALVQSIQAFGQQNNMGNLIDGVGMQCYIGQVGNGADKLADSLLQTSNKAVAQSIPNAVFMFHDLGLEVQFTELTIRNYDESKNAAQAEYYKKFMQMAIDINNGTMTKVLN
ncbi:MAG: endo-1,4-beta-xylanase [Roseburia sp.]|nr:endo-1,4-beta-xylanase [Roseburia sp.]